MQGGCQKCSWVCTKCREWLRLWLFRVIPQRWSWISQSHHTSSRWWHLGFICEYWNQRAVKIQSTYYSLWKARKKLKQVKKTSPIRTPQGTWAWSNPCRIPSRRFPSSPPWKWTRSGRNAYPTTRSPYQCEPLIKRFTSAAIQEVITSLNPKKASGYVLISGKILKELPAIGIKYLTQLFNAIL
jgi:hypothetical protein